ncbi:hypothetical protein FB45DRAFT_1059241 [Roridomyces roridus]|uniref:Uncharacterized protein n=1 Tax=Roridomyces roridus TaxID=1738132 RepID=A0AAD7BRK2_9AGAR|nr:hypothetical protein FB45DRAFT_1059241 [Roridomyces roridus]
MEEEELLWFVGPNWQKLLERPVAPVRLWGLDSTATATVPPIPNPAEGHEYVYGFLITDETLDAYCCAHPIPGEPIPENRWSSAEYKQRALSLLVRQMDFRMHIEPRDYSDLGAGLFGWFASTKNGVVRPCYTAPPAAEILE